MKAAQNALTFISGKRLYLLYADDKGMPSLLPIIQKLVEKNHRFELNFKMDNGADITDWLSKQKMGCYFYGAGTWETIKRLKQIAESIGFSNAEMQLIAVGRQDQNVFCSKCHMIQPARSQLITCNHCGLRLSVSKHYSSYHQAYLGYPS